MQTEAKDAKNEFLTDIFASIPTQVQCQMLLRVANTINNTIEQCRLLLLAMKKFPSLVNEHGLKLLETLLTAERHSNPQTSVNCYRKLLVCDVLPMVLSKTKAEVPQKQLYKWLQKAIEFYISYVTMPPPPASSPGELGSPELHAMGKKHGGKKWASIAGLSDKESQVSDPWGALFQLLLLLGQKIGWDVEANFFSNTRDYQWQYIVSLYNRDRQTEAGTYHKQILYMTVVLFVECLFNYVSSVDPELFAQGGANSGPLVLLEAIKGATTELTTEPRPKKLRPSENPHLPQIQPSPLLSAGKDIVQNFVTALKCYELLHSSEHLRMEFVKIYQSWMMEIWRWMGQFQTDMFIYQGAFQEAIGHLQNFGISTKGSVRMRNHLQLACCHYCMGNHSKSCELILEVVSVLPSTEDKGDNSVKPLLPGPDGCRQLYLSTCTEIELLPYSIQLLTTCFKEKAFSSTKDDNAMGHMIVLLQYGWPKQEPLFSQAVRKLQADGAFSYSLFFTYIINVDILEEVAFMKTAEGGKVNLDILPTSAKLIAQQRTVTRGVNKGVKEDFRVTMEKQVRRADECVEELIRKFLVEEREVLLQTL
ncbi:integrator complex subunit 10-like isoform X2 [Liolophura sinensis]